MIQQYAEASIPLETFVADSQYMDASQIWTLGANFSQAQMQVRSLCGACTPAAMHSSTRHAASSGLH